MFLFSRKYINHPPSSWKMDQNTNLKKKASKSVVWVLLGSGFGNVLQFISKIILARLLFPEDFGMFALALTFVTFVTSISEFGVTTYLTHKKETPAHMLDTSFYVTCGLGVVCSLILFSSASLISWYFKEVTMLIWVIRVLAIHSFIQCLSVIPTTLLTKELRFKEKSKIEMGTYLLFFIISIVSALYGFGVWSLVIGQVVSGSVNIIALWFIVKWRPTFIWDRKIFLEILHLGKYMFGVGILTYYLINLSNYLIGKSLDLTVLGYYSVALSIANIPATFFSLVVSSVAFSIFAMLQNRDQVAKAYTRIMRLNYFIIFFACLIIFLFIPEFVQFAIGQRWEKIIPLVHILVLFTIFRCYHHVGSYLLYALGKANTFFFVCLIDAIITFPILFVGITFFGVEGVAWGMVILFVISSLILMAVVSKVIVISYTETIKCILPEAVVAIATGAVMMLWKHYILPSTTITAVFVNLIIVALMYVGGVYVSDKQIYAELKTIFLYGRE